jgi:protein SCO1/2
VAHPAGVIVADGGGRIVRTIAGIDYDAATLHDAIGDARAGRGAGGIAARVALLCFGDDPVHGRFAAALLLAVRIVAVSTMLGLAFVFLRHWRRAGPS